jgi:hypothetical protein
MLTRTLTLSRPAPVAGLFISILLVGGLAACTAGPPASSPTPGTTPTPGTSPSPAGSPISSPSPNPSPTANPTTGGGEISHPTGSTDVVLRMEQGGGFVPLGWLVTQAPEFTLYGDGTFLIKPLEDPELAGGWGSAQPRFLQGRLDEDSMQALLQFALGPGRLAAAREDYAEDGIADASTTIFTINAGGISKVVSIYALSEVSGAGPDAVDRGGFHDLAELLRSFEERARAGELGEVALYEPTHYRVTLMESFGELPTEPVEWPWQHITPDDFAAVEEFGQPQAILPAEDVALLTDVPSGGHPDLAVDYEGTLWLLSVRPLLPDETPEG